MVSAEFLVNKNRDVRGTLEYKRRNISDNRPAVVEEDLQDFFSHKESFVSCCATWRLLYDDNARNYCELTAEKTLHCFLLFCFVWTKEGCTYEVLVRDTNAKPEEEILCIERALTNWRQTYELLAKRIQPRQLAQARATITKKRIRGKK